MIDCMFLGDSIAEGTQQFRPKCIAYAERGINSSQWNKRNANKNLNAKTVIISLGSNDHENVRTLWELQKLRTKVDAERVFWILPANNPDIQQMVQLVAKDYGDTVLPIEKLANDKIHPTWSGYRKLAEQTK